MSLAYHCPTFWEDAIQKKTSDKADAATLYSFIELTTVFLLWGVLFIADFSFDLKVLPYSFLFAAFFAMGMIGRIFAFKTGLVSLTSLIIQTSLILVCIWGMVFWEESFNAVIAVGLLLVLISLFLCLYKGKNQEGEEKKKVSFKWILLCILGFIGNAGCTIVQRVQQLDFDGQHKSMLMFFATCFVAIFGFLAYWKSDKTDTKAILKKQTPFPVLAGASNVLLNVSIMMLATASPLLSTNLIYPAVAIGGLIITSLFSVVALKEKLKWWQWMGVGLGIIATGLLS